MRFSTSDQGPFCVSSIERRYLPPGSDPLNVIPTEYQVATV